MRIIFLNRFAWPDEPATAQLLADLTGQLAARGATVAVIASHPGGAVPQREIREGVELLRVRSTRWGRRSLPGRAVDFATFIIGALWRLARTTQRGDAVVCLTDPPLLGLAAWLVARARGARIFHWVQDIYPEIAMELAGQRWLRVVRPLRDLAWRHADGCVTLGTDMASVLTGAGVAENKIFLVPNWGPAGLVPPPPSAVAVLRAAWGVADKFVVAYSGNLGRVHDLWPVLDVAAALRDDAGIVFLFIGSGAQRLALESAAIARGLAHVRFLPPQPRAQLAESLAAGDAHLVTLLPGCERLVFPSKLYGVTAIGRPVIFIGPAGCELARLVRERDLGVAFSRDEPAAIAAALRHLRDNAAARSRHGAAALAFAQLSGSAPAAAQAWWQLLGGSPQACAAAEPATISGSR